MNYWIFILLLIAMLSVSTAPIIGKLLVNIDPIAISFWRMFIGATALWLYSGFYYQKSIKRKNIPKTIISGIFLGVHFFLFFYAVKMTKISNATFLGTLAPIFTLIIEVLILRRRINKLIFLGLAISLLGSLIIIISDFNFSSDYTMGNFAALLCSMCLAVSFIISENIRNDENTISYTRSLYFFASLTLFIISIIYQVPLIGYNQYEILGLLTLGLIPTILGHNILYYTMKFISPTIVATFPMGEPLIASIMGFIIFGESINISTLIGGSIIISGLFSLSIIQYNYEKSQ